MTLTSEKQTHPEAMAKRFRYCSNKLSDHLYGKHWGNRGLGTQWVVGLERTKRGWPHAHACVRTPLVDARDRDQLDWGYWQRWFSETGGHCWLEPVRSQAAVVAYVTKYVVKDGELELSPNLELTSAPGQTFLPLVTRPGGQRLKRTQPDAQAAAAAEMEP